MQVLIELTGDQLEQVTKEGLMKSYETHLSLREPEDHHIHEAFQIMLAYFMTDKEYRKYAHGLAKVTQKYNAKRLAEANNGH
jgi:regulatory protein YycH of two-component signal transduction system YycFG